MKLLRYFTVLALLSLLLFPVAAFGQDRPPEKGSIEFGVRGVWGDVYGRPDLPFQPDLITSKFNEYGDRRNGMFIRRLDLLFDDVFGSKNYIALQSQSSFYKNQSYLATFGQYGKFKIQFRYDEIPHVYTNTTRTIFTETRPGVFTVPLALKTALQTQSSNGTASAISAALPGYLITQVLCGPAVPPSTQPSACDQQFITPAIRRKAGTLTVNYNFTPDLSISGMYSRENQVGHRPIALIFNSSPLSNASTQPGTTSGRQSPGPGVEVPESIDYWVDNFNVMMEYGREQWAIQFGYTGSVFQNNISELVVDNPFATADVPVQLIPPGGGCSPTPPAVNCAIGAVPSKAQMDLYPDNSAHYLNFSAMVGIGKRLNLLGTVNPGWLRQNDLFLPYTANTAITGLSPLPSPSLVGKKQTLAMNWTLVADIAKGLEVALKYRHYDYNNDTPERTFTPVQGDTIGANSTATAQNLPGTVDNHPFGYNRKTLELVGNWFFAKRNSVKLGYEGEWFDREHRDVHESIEHSFIAAADISPWKELLFRAAYRYSNRTPQDYQDELAEVGGVLIPCSDTTTTGFTDVQRCSRRFDEAARILNRADLSLQYDFKDFSFTGSFQTIQADYNRAGGVNSATPLNFLTGAAATTDPYYLYGLLKDISYVWSFDATYSFSPEVSLFAEYAKETYYKRMISRYRVPTSGSILTCNGCDTPNNDWESTYSDLFDTYAAGLDLFLAKKVYFTTFYSLSDGKGRIPSRYLGDPTIVAPATTHRFLLVGTTAAVPYPQSNTRIHDLAIVLKYKLNDKVMPKFEYRLQQFDNNDAQTSVMVPYMGCISPATGTAVTGCPVRLIDSTTSPTPVLSPNGASPFYPGFQVGDTAAARFIFLGADQPSYRAHVFSATLEIRF
jgi:MtrB/PioB family decaheme-associated outer membrane protein